MPTVNRAHVPHQLEIDLMALSSFYHVKWNKRKQAYDFYHGHKIVLTSNDPNKAIAKLRARGNRTL